MRSWRVDTAVLMLVSLFRQYYTLLSHRQRHARVVPGREADTRRQSSASSGLLTRSLVRTLELVWIGHRHAFGADSLNGEERVGSSSDPYPVLHV